jgi:hypothetical protein
MVVLISFYNFVFRRHFGGLRESKEFRSLPWFRQNTHANVRKRWFYEPVALANTSRTLVSFPTELYPSKPPLVSFGDSSASRPVHMGLVSVSSGISSSGFLSGAVVRVSDASPNHDGARTYTPLYYPGHTGKPFTIQLSYPDGEHSTHLYSVFHGMPVSGLRYNISCLLRVDSLVFLFVGPS